MRLIRAAALAFSLSVCSLWALSPAFAQVTVAISVDVIPPPLPVYDQPPIPGVGYMWVPGYWAWDDNVGYFWVPGTWVLPPQPGLLWTPGYWGWDNGYYVFHEGYWGPHVGFYGGIAYGFGYTGLGYEGGYWRNGAFFYNRSVTNITNVSVTNVYEKTVIVNNPSNVSFNGGSGGTTARPTAEQLAAAQEQHIPATAEQMRHMQTAAKDPALSLATNHGHPAVAATANPAVFKGSGVVAAHPGNPIPAVLPQGHSKTSTTTGPGPKAGTEILEHKGPAGAGTTTGPSGAAGTEVIKGKGNVGVAPPAPGVTPEAKKLPPTPQISKPAGNPPPRPTPPPSPRNPPPSGKPKCEPGQKCD